MLRILISTSSQQLNILENNIYQIQAQRQPKLLQKSKYRFLYTAQPFYFLVLSNETILFVTQMESSNTTEMTDR